jgi:hypothetical protein
LGRDKLIPPPAGEQDWALASKMLVQETDLLDILQQLRELKVLLMTQTSLNQRQLVKFLEKYCINSSIRLHGKDI